MMGTDFKKMAKLVSNKYLLYFDIFGFGVESNEEAVHKTLPFDPRQSGWQDFVLFQIFRHEEQQDPFKAIDSIMLTQLKCFVTSPFKKCLQTIMCRFGFLFLV